MQNETKYTLISDLSEIDTVLSNTSIIACDTETEGLNPHKGRLRLIQIADEHGGIYLIDCFEHRLQAVSSILKPHFENKNLKTVWHNAVFDLKWLKHHLDIEVATVFDTLLAYRLINIESVGVKESGKLKSILGEYFGLKVDKTEQLSDWTGILSKSQLLYAAIDVKYLLKLRELMIEQLKALNVIDAATLEFSVIPAVAAMELNGFPVDIKKFAETIDKTELERDECFSKLQHFLLSGNGKHSYERTYTIDLFGDEIQADNEYSVNLRSSKQLKQRLFECGIDIPSTSKKIIPMFVGQYPNLKYLVDFRDKEKLCSSFGRNFLQNNVLNSIIYPSFSQIGTRTYRFSSNSPNLQQIPSTKEFRSIFAAPKGYKLIIADMSQIELRILADYSQDTVMLDAFNTGRDLHSLTTSLIFNIPYDECKLDKNKRKRTQAKQVNFGIAYGIGPPGLSVNLKGVGIDATEDECQQTIDTWHASYPQAGKWLKKQRYQVNNKTRNAELGKKMTVEMRGIDNRILKTSFIAGDKGLEAGSKRDCMNFLIQSGSAISMKHAFINMHNDLKINYPEAKIVNLVHDEAVLVVKEEQAEEIKELVVRHMVEGAEYYFKNVKIEAEAKIADSWAEK